MTDAASWDTVTGFTGQVSTGGLVEFATRTFDPASRVWLQDDSYRGATTRAASLNRYAYVEGAPESFVDVLGFYRAAAAIRAQALAAAQAAYDEALKALRAVEGEYLRGSVSVPGLGTLPRYIAQGLVGSANYQAYLERFLVAAETRRQVQAQEWAAHKAAAQAQREAEARAAAKREADSHKNWWDRAVDATVNTVTNVVTAQAGGSKCSSIAGAAYFVFSAGVNCQYDQAQYYEFDPVEQLDIAWHGVVNFGGGAVNGASSLVNGLTGAANWGNNTCASVHLCIDIPDIAAIPAVPIWGDYDTYKYSSWSGSTTTFVASLLAPGVAAETSLARAAALERVLWSGRSGYAAASESGGVMLENTAVGGLLTNLTKVTGYSATKPLWDFASRTFVRTSEGPIRAFIGTSAYSTPAQTTFARVEYPEAIKRGVQVVIEWLS